MANFNCYYVISLLCRLHPYQWDFRPRISGLLRIKVVSRQGFGQDFWHDFLSLELRPWFPRSFSLKFNLKNQSRYNKSKDIIMLSTPSSFGRHTWRLCLSLIKKDKSLPTLPDNYTCAPSYTCKEYRAVHVPPSPSLCRSKYTFIWDGLGHFLLARMISPRPRHVNIY